MDTPKRLPLSGGKLVSVTQYGKRLPAPQPPSRLSVAKEMKRMETEKDNLNAMEKVSPNPLNKKTKAKLTPDKLGSLTQDELDELLASIAGAQDSEMEAIQKMTQPNPQDKAMQDILDKFASSLASPQFSSFRAPSSYQSPGFFQG